MAGGLGTIAGNIIISGKQAIAEYAAVRAANASTVAALTAASAVFAKVGLLALGAAAPIAFLFGSAVNAAADFEKKIDYFGAVTNATQADMEAVAQKALDMSRTTVFSAGQMADAFVEFGKAGIDTKDILNGVAESTAALAQAADINMTDAASIIVSTMSTFNIKAEDSIRIANELAGAANASIIDISDLGTSLKYAGGVAQAAGIPFESVVDALALLGNAGLKGSTAGTTLRQVMVSLTGPTKAAKDQLAALGIITKENGNLFIDQAGKLKPLDQIFQILKEHTVGLTQAQTLAATKVIFNSRALAGANVLLQQGAAGFAEMNAEIAKTTALDVATKRLDNLSGDMTKLKNAWQTFLIQAGQPFQEMMRGIVQRIISLLQWFGALSPSTQKLILQVLFAVGAFLALTGVISLSISLALKVAATWLKFVPALKLVAQGIGILGSAFRALGVILLANPLFLLITAIVLIVAALVYAYFHFEGFRKVVDGVFKWVINAAKVFWHALVEAFDAVVNAAKATWHGLETAFNAVKDFLISVGKTWYAIFVNPIVQMVKAVINVFESIGSGIAKAVSAILDWLKIHWRLIVVLVLGPIGVLIAAVTNHWDWVKNTTVTVFTAILNFFKAVFNAIWGVIKPIIDLIVQIHVTAFNAIWTAIQFVWNAIVSYYTFIWNLISTIFTTAVNIIQTIITTAWNAIQTATTTVWNAIVAFFTPIVNTIRNVLSAAFNGLKSVVETVWSAIKAAISATWDAIKPILDFIKTVIDGVQTAIYDLGTVWGRTWEFIKTVISKAWDYIRPIVDAIKSAIDTVSGAVKTVTGGISGAAGAVSNFLGFATGGTVPGAKGRAQLAVVHGGEEVISNDMLSGRKPFSNRVLSALAASQAANSESLASLRNLAISQGVNSSSPLSRIPQSSIKGNDGGFNNYDRSIKVDKIVNNYPKPEPASDSLPRTVRTLAYLSGGPVN